jgi:exodeoxyribonuclease VIII
MAHENDKYREDIFKKEMSFSSLKWVRKSMALYKFRVQHPEIRVETPALIFGNLFHTTVLEPEKLKEKYFTLDPAEKPEKDKSMNSAENKAWKIKTMEDNIGKRLVEPSDIKNAEGMRDSVMEQAGEFITNAVSYEKELHWQKRGVNMKAYLDGDAPSYAFDLKSALDATPQKWQRKAFWEYDSDMQAAIYLDGSEDGIYTGDKDFYFIAVEKVPPYLVSVHFVSRERIKEGMFKYTGALEKLKAHRKSNEWPHFDKEVFEWN